MTQWNGKRTQIIILILLLCLGPVNYFNLQHTDPRDLQNAALTYTGKCVDAYTDVKYAYKSTRLKYLSEWRMAGSSGLTEFILSKETLIFLISVIQFLAVPLPFAISMSITAWAPLQRKQWRSEAMMKYFFLSMQRNVPLTGTGLPCGSPMP